MGAGIVAKTSFLIIISSFNFCVNDEKAPFGMCSDPDCTDPVAIGITLINRPAPEKDSLSFAVGIKVEIYVKNYGPKKDKLGIEINGKKGYVGKNTIREETVLHANLVPAAKEFVSGAPAAPETPVSSLGNYEPNATPVISTPSQEPSEPYSNVNIESRNPVQIPAPSPSPTTETDVYNGKSPVPTHMEVNSIKETSSALDGSSSASLPNSITPPIHESSSAATTAGNQPTVPPTVPPADDFSKHSISDIVAVELARSTYLEMTQSAVETTLEMLEKSMLSKSSPVTQNVDYSTTETVTARPLSAEEETAKLLEKLGENISDYMDPLDDEENGLQDTTVTNRTEEQAVPSVPLPTSVSEAGSISSFTDTAAESTTKDESIHAKTAATENSVYGHGPPNYRADNVVVMPSLGGHKRHTLNTETESESSPGHADAKSFKSPLSDTGDFHIQNSGMADVKNKNTKTVNSGDVPHFGKNTNTKTVNSGDVPHFGKNTNSKTVNSGDVPHFGKNTNSKTVNSGDVPHFGKNTNTKTVNSGDVPHFGNIEPNANVVEESSIESENMNAESKANIYVSSSPLVKQTEAVATGVTDVSLNHTDSILNSNKKDTEHYTELNETQKSSVPQTDVPELNADDSIKHVLVNSLPADIESKDQLNPTESYTSATADNFQHLPEIFNENISENFENVNTLNNDISGLPSDGLKIDVQSENNSELQYGKAVSVADNVNTLNNDISGLPSDGLKIVVQSENNSELQYGKNVSVADTELLNDGQSSHRHDSIQTDDRSYIVSDLQQESTDVDEPIASSFTEDITHNINSETVIEMEDASGLSFAFVIECTMEMVKNFVTSLRAFLDYAILWSPEPLHSYLKDVEASGISARAIVFTEMCAVPCLLLFLGVLYLKISSKEKHLSDQLRDTEHKLYLTCTDRDSCKSVIESAKEQIILMAEEIQERTTFATSLEKRLLDTEGINKSINFEQETSLDTINCLSRKNEEYAREVENLKMSLAASANEHEVLSRNLQELKNIVLHEREENIKLKEEVEQLMKEKAVFHANVEEYKGQVSHLRQSCTKLLQEIELWNAKVNELNGQLDSQASLKTEMEELLSSKDLEIESMKTTIESFQVLQNLKDSGEADNKTLEENLHSLMDVSKVQNKLKRAEEMSESLSEQLNQERNKVLEMEVELLDSKSEAERLIISCERAVQDKADAQKKLHVLNEYFKDKELQLQKELGAQEAFRQRKEEDASHAERRLQLIEEENSCYKYQIASLKQEIEETERNLKNQIATQEKKAHENWLAARAAERKSEEMKQENAQLRQRLTLLEREQEHWSSSNQADVIKPVPQRMLDAHDVSGSNDGSSISMEFVPRYIPPPPLLGRFDDLPPHLHPLSMMPPPPLAPSGRPLLPSGTPPLMPPPPFLPPFDLRMPLHRPWRPMPDKHLDSERRNTPSDFESTSSRQHRGTPPPSYYGGERQSVSPPGDLNSRSRGSTPPEALPDFHNIPPALSRHREYLPPPPHMRGPPAGPPPPHTMHRRDLIQNSPPGRPGNRSEGNDDTRRMQSGSQLRQHYSDAEV